MSDGLPVDEVTPTGAASELSAVLCRTAFALYRPPFRFEHGYIWDAGNNMVADQDDACSDAVSNEIARVRGWGRICSMPEPMVLQDAVGALIANALTEYWTRHNDGVNRRCAQRTEREAMNTEIKANETEGMGAASELSAGLERPSMRCMICGLKAYARDVEMDKYGKSHYDCESGGHSFYPRAMERAL